MTDTATPAQRCGTTELRWPAAWSSRGGPAQIGAAGGAGAGAACTTASCGLVSRVVGRTAAGRGHAVASRPDGSRRLKAAEAGESA